MCAAPQIEMFLELKKKNGDISTPRRRDSRTHTDHDLNFQRLPPGNTQVHSGRDGRLAAELASY